MIEPVIVERPPTVDDAATLLPLFEAYDVATLGEVDITLADIDGLLRDARADLAAGRIVLDSAGVALALMLPTRQSLAAGASAVVDLEIMVHPDVHAKLFVPLLDEAESYVRQVAGTRGLPVVAEHWAVDPPVIEALLGRGFGVTGTHVRYSRDLDGSETEPEPRDGLRVVPAETEAEQREFHATLVAAFADANEAHIAGYEDWSQRMAWLPPSCTIRRSGGCCKSVQATDGGAR